MLREGSYSLLTRRRCTLLFSLEDLGLPLEGQVTG